MKKIYRKSVYCFLSLIENYGSSKTKNSFSIWSNIYYMGVNIPGNQVCSGGNSSFPYDGYTFSDCRSHTLLLEQVKRQWEIKKRKFASAIYNRSPILFSWSWFTGMGAAAYSIRIGCSSCCIGAAMGCCNRIFLHKGCKSQAVRYCRVDTWVWRYSVPYCINKRNIFRRW